MSEPRFFTLIIGTEILNRRRADAHFDFVSKALADKGYTLSGSFIIEDDPALIIQTLQFITSQPNAILFSFGGIGSTPDDYTRQCVAEVLGDGQLYLHAEAKDIIETKLGENAYPHAIKMAELPHGVSLLDNPINKMPAFSLGEKYFFVPGFPEMSHPMITKVIDTLLPQSRKHYRHTLVAHCKESELIEVMEQMPKDVEFSSLPKLKASNTWEVSISVASYDASLASTAFKMYTDNLETKNIPYNLTEQM